MAIQVYYGNNVGAGIIADLDELDDALVLPNALVYSTDAAAMRGTGSGHRVDVQGTAVGMFVGLYLGDSLTADSGHHVTIGSAAYVVSKTVSAITIYGAGSAIENAGKIWGHTAGIYLLGNGGASRITNTGIIDGQRAISTDGNQVVEVRNSGLITGHSYAYDAAQATGIDLITNTGRMTGTVDLGAGNDVYSGASGRLAGKVFGGAGSDAIAGGIDNDWFDGGTGNDVLRGNSGNDRLDGGAGADTMFGGAGNDAYLVDNPGDIVNETGGNGIDTVFSSISFSLANAARVPGAVENLTLAGSAVSGAGNALSNTVAGNAVANTLAGLAGNDRLYGGLGNDTLAGGTGNDVFIFHTVSNAASNRDTIADFANAAGNNDAIWLDNAVFTRLTATGMLSSSLFRVGTAAQDANDHIVYNKATGALFYDADGSGAGGAVQFATLATKPVLTYADFGVI